MDRRPGDGSSSWNLRLGITSHVAIGPGLWAALGNISSGVGVGVAIGTAIGISLSSWRAG